MQSLHATLPRAEAWAALKRRALALVHRYSENEPRDEGGKWTDGGGGDEVGFVSPNVGNLTFDQAKASLAGGRQKMLAAASKDIDSRLGKEPADVQNVIGAWSDGAENSLMLEMHGWSENEARVALAMKGYVGDQKSALLFTPDTVGKSFLASFPVKGDIGAIHDAVASDGLQFHTLEPTSSGAIVHVYGDDQATIDKITQAAHGADVKITFGHGEFIGTTKEDGNDREQRDDARKQYDAVIAAAAASPEFSGRDLGKTWDAIRNSWSGKLSEVKSARWAALKRRSHALLHRFDPGESRDEHGRWTDGGGGDFDVDKVEAKTDANVGAASAAALAGGQKHLDGSKSQHPGTIASRNPTAKGSVAVYGQPDLATMKADQKAYKHNVDLFKNANFYPNFRAKDLSGSTDEAAKTIVDEMKGNLEFLYQFADKKDKVWYDGARAIADDRAKVFGFNEASVAGAIAAMSPQKEWDDNVHQADMVMETYKNQQNHRWDDKMNEWSKTHWKIKNQPIVDLVRGKTLGELTDPKEKALWIRTYDAVHNSQNYRTVLANGALGDFKRNDDKEHTLSKTRWQTLPAIKSAIVALEANGDRKKISEVMGTAHKVRSFYNNILDPHSANGDVTIDTHAVGAALLRQLTGADAAVLQNFGDSPEKKDKPEGWEGTSSSTKSGLSGTYAIYAEAYREAAKDLGVQPRQLQSIVWVAKRKTFGEASEKKQQAIEMAWHDYHDNKQTLEQTRDSIANILELKKNERRVDGYDDGERRAADARELHRSGVGSAAAGMDGGAGSGAAGRIARLVAIRNARRQAIAKGLRGFDPDEPRDEGGKWTDGGGDGGDDGVTSEEASALHHYQGTYHTAGGEVNGYMRHPAEMDEAAKKNPALQKLIGSYKTEANAINDAMGKSELKETSTLWRVLGQTYGKKLLKDGPKLVGQDLPAVGFQSTSKSKEFDKVADKMPVRLKIIAPKGAHALDIDNLKGFNKDYQKEILLGEGHYHVDKWVKEKGKAQGVLEVTYVEGPRRTFS